MIFGHLRTKFEALVAEAVSTRDKYRNEAGKQLGFDFFSQKQMGDSMTRLTYEGVLSAASMVPGVEEFLSMCECPLYLCSSAPPGEVSRQLGARNLLGYFAATFDCRTSKDVALKLIASRHGKAGVVVFFGDSLGDLSAAQSAQVPFVAVVAEWDNFPNHEVVKLHDFADRRAIQRCISEATAAYAI